MNSEAVAVVDEGDEGIFVEVLYGENGSSLKRGDFLYASRDAEISKLAGVIWEEVSVLGAKVNRYENLFVRLLEGVKHKGWSIGTDVYCEIERFAEEIRQ